MTTESQWIEVPTAGDHVVLMPLGCAHPGYVRALAAAATMRLGHPAIRQPDEALVGVVRDTWRAVAPGWAAGDVTGIMAHHGLAHHMRMVGAKVLSPERFAAYRKVVAECAEGAQLLAYLGYAEHPSIHSLMDLIMTEGSCIAASGASLDADAFDDEDDEPVDVRPAPYRGDSVEQVLRG